MLFLSPSDLDGSLLNLQQCLSSLKSWFFHNGLALNSDKTEAICLGTTHRRQSLSDLASIQVADASVTLSDHIKLLGVTLDNRLSFDKHVSNVCSISYFHIRALRHIRTCLDLESSKSIACAIVGSRLDYANSCLSGVSSYNIHRLQRVQNCLARVVMPTRPVIASQSLYLLYFTGSLSINELLSNLLVLFIVAFTEPLLPIFHHFCMHTLQHERFDPPRLTFLLNLVFELHLLLGASVPLDHASGTLYPIISNLLLLYPLSDPNSKLTSLSHSYTNFHLVNSPRL